MKYHLLSSHLKLFKFNITNSYTFYLSSQDSLLLFLLVTRSKVNEQCQEAHIFSFLQDTRPYNVKWECKEKADWYDFVLMFWI